MLVSASNSDGRFVPLWRASRRLLALGAVLLILLSASVVYSYSEKVAPTSLLKVTVDVFYNSTTASTATVKALSVGEKTIYINKLTLTVAGAPGVRALQRRQQTFSLDVFNVIKTQGTEDTSTASKLDDYSDSGRTDAPYFLVKDTLETWLNDTTYYTSSYLDNSDGKLVLYAESLDGAPVVKVNNTVYWNESLINSNYSDSFWWVPLPTGKLANISITGVTGKTVFKLVRVVWYTLDYRFISADSDLNSLEPEEGYTNDEETLLIGTTNLDDYIRSLIDEKLKAEGYSDIVEQGYEYNVTDPNVGIVELKYSTIEASIFGVLRFTLFSYVRLGWFDSISNAFKSTIKRLQFGIGGYVNDVVLRVKKSANWLKKNWQRVRSVYIANAKKAVKKAAEAGKGFIASVSSAIGGTVKAVGNFFNNVGKTISKAVSGFVNNVVNGAKAVWNGVTSFAGKVWHGITGFFGGIVSWFKKFWWAILLVAIIFIMLIGIFVIQPFLSSRRRF